MGRCSYGDPHIIVFEGDRTSVIIGAFASIAPGVELMLGGNHRTDWVSTFPLRARLGLPGAFGDGHPATKGDIVIGNYVWIGQGARILSGIHIGDGAVVAAHAVVTQNVRDYAIVGGNPAREIRRRFTDDEITALKRISWWDWPMDDIVAAVSLLNDTDVTHFIDRFDHAETDITPSRSEGDHDRS
jgi:acetyltransferase-like isoleucine patch superfamily enzyme